jgi:perosamine synthetase
MSNLQAAVGVAQLECLDAFIERKHTMGQYYTEQFSDIEEIQLPIAKMPYAENIYWVYGIVLKNNKINGRELMQKLHAEGIGSRAFFYPMHLQPVLQKMGLFLDEHYPVAEHLAQQGIYIPSGLALSRDEMALVSKKLKKVLTTVALPC